MNRWVRFAAAAAAALVLAACSPGPVVVRSRMPLLPDCRAAARFRRVAVLPLAGAHGPETTALVAGAVAAATIGTGPWYGVDPAAQPVVAASGGAWAPAAAFQGQVLLASARPTRTSERRCETKDDKGKCTRQVERVCVGAEATFSFRVSLLELATRAEHCAQVFTGAATLKEECEEQEVQERSGLLEHTIDAAKWLLSREEEPPTDGIVAEARARAVAEFAATLPRVAEYDLELAPAGDDAPKAARKLATRALRRAENGYVPDACAMLAEAAALAPGSGALRYDLGACAELAGRFDEAARLHAEAAERLPGDPRVALALARLEKLRADREFLERLVP